MASKVFVIQESNFDYSKAEKFGEVVFVTSLEYNSVPGSNYNKRIIADIRKAFSDYIPGEDYLIPTGSPALMALVMVSIGAKWPNQSHQILKWGNMERDYKVYKEIEAIL